VALLQGLAKQFPDDARYRVDLGVALFAAGGLRESEEDFRSALRLDPENLSAWSSLAAVYRAEGEPDLAAGVDKKILDGICSRTPRPAQCDLFSEPVPAKSR
jgi:cytochrome c-type biogenesis protein CcmH/NrfG